MNSKFNDRVMVTFQIPVKDTLIDSLGKEAIEKASKQLL